MLTPFTYLQFWLSRANSILNKIILFWFTKEIIVVFKNCIFFQISVFDIVVTSMFINANQRTKKDRFSNMAA